MSYFSRSSLFFFLVLALLVPPGAEAASVTLLEAYSSALESNERVGIAGEQLIRSRKDIRRAYSQVFPSVRTDATYRRFSDRKMSSGGILLQPDDSTSVEVSIEQLVFGGGKEWSGIKEAKKLAASGESRLDDTRGRVLLDTARTYFAALKAMREVEISEAALKRAREQHRVSRARLKAGTATKTLVLRAEAEVAGSEAALIGAENDLKNAIERLKRVSGVTGEVELVEPPKEVSLPYKVEELIARALQSRDDYRSMVADEGAAKEGVGYAKGQFLPTLTLGGSYSYREQSPETAFLLNDTLSADLTLSFPIFSGGLRVAELGQARSRLREAELRRLTLKRDVAVEVREAYNNVNAFSAVINSLAKQLAFSKENYEMVFKQFTYGLADNMDVIDAETTLVSAERGLTNAELDHQLAILELKKSVGSLLNEVEGAANALRGG